METKVAVIGFFRFPPQNMPEIRPHLKELLEATRRNDGCIAYDAAEDVLDPGLIRFTELWPDHESLERHLRAAHIEPWRAAVRSFDLIERQFTVYDISGSKPL